MGSWNPWRGCHRYRTGCKHCYVHKGDYKMKSGQMVYVCFSSDFLLEDADKWRTECWEMIRERSDLHFLFLTKRIERFLHCIPHDWKDGYENVTVGCTIENQ